MRRARVYVALLMGILLIFSGCGEREPPPSASEVLAAMQAVMEDTAQILPEGLVYTRASSPTDPGYLNDTLFSALYGETARGLLADEPSERSVISDAALFLSVAPYPCELAVFRCSDTRGASSVARLCRGRLDTIRRGFAAGEWADVAAGGQVVVQGCYVLLAVAEDPHAILHEVKGWLP